MAIKDVDDLYLRRSTPGFGPDDHFKKSEPFSAPVEADPPPWRGIATETLPTDIKKQLPCHYREWIVVDPEQVRHRRVGNAFVLFAESRKGWRAITSLSELCFAQRHFALVRRQNQNHSQCGGGMSGSFKRFQASEHRRSTPLVCADPPPGVRISHPPHRAALAVGDQGCFRGNDILRVSGEAYDAHRIRIQWQNFNTGQRGSTLQKASPSFGSCRWEELIEGCQPGRYQISVRAESPGGVCHDRVEVRIVEEVVSVAEILFETRTNTFHLLRTEDLQFFQAAARPYDEAVADLENAYQRGDQKDIEAAKQQLDRTLAPLIHSAADSSTLTEVIGFRGARYTYLDAEDLKSHWRRHRIEDMTQNTLLTDGEFDLDKLKNAFGDKKAQLTWELIDPCSHTLADWARGFNARTATMLLPPDNPNRRFDVSPQAQLMRYTHGASLKGNIDFSKRRFGLTGESQVTLSLAEGRADFNAYVPREEGHALRFDYTVASGPRRGETKRFDCGHIRARLQAALSGFAGASLQAGVGVHFDVASGGRVELRGATRNDRNEEDTTVDMSGEAFAGLKRGCEVSGAAEWRNPESNHQWGVLAEVGAQGTAGVGAGAKGDFFIEYENGRFLIRAKAYLIWGAGGGGGFLFTVNGNTIAEFCQFIYHQLKNNDFNFMDFMNEDAFRYFDILRAYTLLAGEMLTSAYEKGFEFRETMAFSLFHALEDLKNGRVEAKVLAQKILSSTEEVLFQPPEAKGRLLRALCHRPWLSFNSEQEQAIIAVLRTIQTWNEYKEVMEHLTVDGSRIALGEHAWKKGEQVLWDFLGLVNRMRLQYEHLKLLLQRTSHLPVQPQIHTAAVRDNGLGLA
jgi:hypothetical protein